MFCILISKVISVLLVLFICVVSQLSVRGLSRAFGSGLVWLVSVRSVTVQPIFLSLKG